jgi:hypothetical protein
MPRKGTRRIVVEGRPYRWSVNLRGRSECYQVWIEQEGGGQRLLAGYWDAFTVAEGFHDIPASVDLVKPDIIRRMILDGLIHGWKPEQRGLPPLRLQDVGVPLRPRSLVVDGSTYEWTAVESARGRGVTVWIWLEAAGGQRLEGTLDCGGTGQRAAGVAALALVTPSMVRRIIVTALAAGWTPSRRGLAPFCL